jgi:hypothetical protein
MTLDTKQLIIDRQRRRIESLLAQRQKLQVMVHNLRKQK